MMEIASIYAILLSFLLVTSIGSMVAYADSKADIINDLARAAEGNFDKYEILAGKFVNSSDLFIVYNRSDVSNSEGLIQCEEFQHIENDKCVPNSGPVPNPGPGPEPEPTPSCGVNAVWDPAREKCVCIPGYHEDETESCVIDTEEPGPGPEPTPEASTTSIVVMGDVKGNTGIKVSDAAKKENADNYVTVGDSGYTKTTEYYNTNFEQKLGPGKNDCVIGNHDEEEDGSAQLGKDFAKLCGDHWSRVTANGTTLLVGLNTNGDRQTQIDYYKDVVDNGNYSNILVFSHKNGHIPPNSHHPAEAAALYKAVEDSTPDNIRLLQIYGHNHIMGAAWVKGWFIIGAGGASHYSCGTNETWTFCNNDDYGYLKIVINNNNAALTAAFYDINGKILN